MEGHWIVAIVMTAFVALGVGFGMGVNSVKKDIGNYGCEAVINTWRQ